jgi:hypothetical protein
LPRCQREDRSQALPEPSGAPSAAAALESNAERLLHDRKVLGLERVAVVGSSSALFARTQCWLTRRQKSLPPRREMTSEADFLAIKTVYKAGEATAGKPVVGYRRGAGCSW